MPTLPKIEGEMVVTTNMKQIMSIMKGIAMSAFVDIKKKREDRFTEYLKHFNSFFQVADLTKAKSSFVQSASPTVCVIAVTSNESFMAGLNNKVIREGLRLTQGRERHFIITGPRMIGRLKGADIPYTLFPGFREINMHDVATQIKDHVIDKIKSGEFGKVIAIFADPVSLSSQEIKGITLLPAHDAYPAEMNDVVDMNETIYQESYIDDVMEFLSEIWVTNKLIQMFQDNKMSEFACQAMQLDGSIENLKDLEKKLKLQYVKTRREVIDTSLRETVAAMLVTGAGS